MTGYVDVSGNGMEVLTNQCGVASPHGGANDISAWNILLPADQEIQIDMPVRPPSGGGYAVFVWRLQATSSYDNTYETEIDEVTPGTQRVRVYKIVATAYTQLGSTHTAFADNDVFYASALGTTILMQQNGTTRVSVSDSAISGSGYLGIGGFADSTFRLDNLRGGGIGAGLKAYQYRLRRVN